MLSGQIYTSSHLLSEIAGVRDLEKHGNGAAMQVGVNCIELKKLALETRIGVFLRTRLVPSGHVFQEMAVAGSEISDVIMYSQLDIYDTEDWDFCRSRIVAPKDKRLFDSIREATEICLEAVRFEHSSRQRQAHIDSALQVCPKHCAMAHFLKFELFVVQRELDVRDKKLMKKVLGYLRSAVSAGKLAAELVRAQDFCPGKFYTWVPTRWLVRSTYILGCALCRMGRWDDADQAFKECLAMDSGDKLGARHKQLIAVLERDGVTGGDELEWLLQAKFGEDEKKDKVYALFNYTRALQAFCIHGDCDKSQSLLEYAVKKNPHVPPVLLAWENTKRAAEIMMLGTDTEAADYCSDNARYWYETTGALDWLERVYCEVKAIEPITNSSEVRQLLVQASQLMMDASETLHSPARKRIKEQGMEKLDHIEKLISNDSRSSSQRLKLILHHRRGMFLVELADFANALAQFNSALCLCDPVSDKDTIKELFYNRADCKKQAGDLRGALDDYTFVYQRFGAFSTAIENIRQLEAQLGASSVLPPRQSFPDVDANGEAQTVNDAMAEIVNNMPKVDLISQHKSSERCSNCQHGGIKLAVCDGCKEIKFCSKQCQIASWKAFHKYVCVGSKSRIATGTKVTVKGLENATHHNGKQGVVTDYLPDRKRFVVEFVSEDGGENKTFKLSLRPQKLSQNVA